MSYIQGEGRSQGTLFPVVLDDLRQTIFAACSMCSWLDFQWQSWASSELKPQRPVALDTIHAIFSSSISMAISISYVHRVGLKPSAAATLS